MCLKLMQLATVASLKSRVRMPKEFPQTGSKKEKENTEYEITHRTFRCIRSNCPPPVRSPRPRRPVKRAKVRHNHEKPGGRVGRARHRPGDAGDVRRQTDAHLAARDLAGTRPRARVP